MAFLWQLQKCSRTHWLIFIVNKQTDTWIYKLCDAATSERDNLTICLRKKQIDVSFFNASVFYWHRQSIIKVVCGSTRLSPLGSTAITLTMLCPNFMINIRTDALKTKRQFVNYFLACWFHRCSRSQSSHENILSLRQREINKSKKD